MYPKSRYAAEGVCFESHIASWRYTEIPHALGCDGWLTARAETCGELEQALRDAERAPGASYIEVVTDKYAAPLLSRKLHENVGTLYH